MNKQRNIYKKSGLDFLRAAVLPVLFTGAVVAMIISGLMQTQESSRAEGLRILEDSIRRAAVTNYAIEGRYPADISEIESRYGVYIDTNVYSVYYNVIASNFMPEIRVSRYR